MDVDDWGDPIKPIDASKFVKRRTSDDELKAMQQRLLRAVSQSIEDSKKQPVAKQIHPLTVRGTSGTDFIYDVRTSQLQWKANEAVKISDLNPGVVAQPAEEISPKDLERLIYDLRDEWSAEKGEWDGTKMPVNVLAEKIMKRIRAYKRPGWGQ